MRTFGVYLKSYTEAPDHEYITTNTSKAKAVEEFVDWLGRYGWSRSLIKEKIVEIKD